MKMRFARTLIVIGSVLIGAYGLYDPLDGETAAYRYGPPEKLPTSQEELEEARIRWEAEAPSPMSLWVLISGAGLLGTGLVLKRQCA